MTTTAYTLVHATSPDDVQAVKALFVEYSSALGFDLCFQDFEAELATFPAFYVYLLLAKVGGSPAAAVALKQLDAKTCEMKRLYCRPEYRGLGLGHALAEPQQPASAAVPRQEASAPPRPRPLAVQMDPAPVAGKLPPLGQNSSPRPSAPSRSFLAGRP